MKTIRNPEGVHHPLAAYSHQIELDASERLLVLSGQIGMRPDGSVPDDPIEQLKITLDNIRLNLDAANMSVSDVVKLTIYLVGQFDPDDRRRILSDYFEAVAPCMTLLFVAALGAPRLKVEIDAIASSDRGQHRPGLT